MLKLSTKGRYATRILVSLAGRESGTFLSVREIAEVEKIPPDYMEQILTTLRGAGLVTSRRGAKGGFRLSCDPERTTVADILSAMEGPVCIIPCLANECERGSACVTRSVWRQANDAITGVFTRITLAQLVREAAEMRLAQAPTYEI